MSQLQVKGKIVVVDDDSAVREMLKDFLVSSGHTVVEFDCGEAAVAAFDNGLVGHLNPEEVDLLITDLSMPGIDGLELTEKIKAKQPDIPVILMTAFGSIESAIEATRKGVYNYVVKPFKLKELSVTIHRAISFRKLKAENEILRNEISGSWNYVGMVGKSKAMHQVFDVIERVANATANVLITGESGTGKELVAKAIHDKSHRKNKPFVAINCTAIPESLLESELFGHAKGSFTGAISNKKGLFEEASGGTIFLDEIGDLDMGLQAKLLRVLQEKKIKPVGENHYRDIDVRVVSATHRDLSKAIRDGSFREDLYYRLSVVPVEIPALRERREDIPLLANHFLRKYAAANRSVVREFSKQALSKLIKAKWEGNVRELENIVERVVVMAEGEVIQPESLPIREQENIEEFFTQTTSDWPTVEELERRYIRLVLEKTGGRKEKAANILGINRRTLYRKEREYETPGAAPSYFSH